MRRALIIANEAYEDGGFSCLPGAIADADALAEVLGDPAIGRFDVTVLRNAKVFDLGVAVADHFERGRPGDVLLLHISGHGLKDAHGDLYFAAADSYSDTHRLRASTLSAFDVRREMADSRARSIIVLLDCCYSGAFTRDDGSRGVEHSNFTEPFRGRGRVVITASGAAELSYEREGRGVFTRAVVEGLRTGDADRNGDGVIDTDELYRYVVDAMRQEVRRQTPTLSAHNVEGVLEVAWNPQYRPAMRPDPDPLGAAPRPRPLQGDPARPGKPSRLLDAARTAAIRLRHRGRRVAERLTARPSLDRRAGVPILAASTVLIGLGAHADAAGPTVPGCVRPAEVRVATSAAGHQAYREVADAFERWTAERNDGCATARLHLYPAPADRVRDGIRAGWPESGGPGQRYLQEVGPHPDLWLPESHSDLDRVRADGGNPVVRRAQTIASSPVILGVPADLVDVGRDTGQRTMVLTWRQLFAKAARPAGTRSAGLPDGAGWAVVRADPTTSVVARLATVALYTAQGGLIDAFRARQDVEQWLERALDAGAYPIADDAALLCRHRSVAAAPDAAPPAAVIMSEQDLIRFNEGRPLGGGCGTPHPSVGGNRLQAFYPADAPVVFKSVVQLRWRDAVQSRAGRLLAAHFVTWLTAEAAGKRALLRAGLRPPGHDIGAPVDTSNGALSEWPFGQSRDVSELPVELQDRAMARYREAHRPGRILVALDASGSMAAPAGDRRRSRFGVALDGLEQSLKRMGGRDEFGLLTFSTTTAATSTAATVDLQERTPIGRSTAAQASSVRAAAQQIQPSGDTPLYRGIRRGIELVRDGGGGSLRAVVVLTDGQDTSGESPPTAADAGGVRIYALAVGGVACEGSVLDGLARGTGGHCFDAASDAIDDVLGRLFHGLWAGAS